MNRYFTTPRKSKAWEGDELYDGPMSHVPEVCDHEAMDTGLVDANGDRIFRAPNPIGFLWGGEL